MTLLICNGYQIHLDKTYQIFFILFQGLLLVSLFAPLHECSHSTAFKSKFLNQAVMFFCGMVHLMPSIWFKEFHMEHHRHTQDPTMDPELGNERPRSIGSYLFLISGIRIWIDLVQNFFRLFSGNANQSYIREHNIQKVILEVRFLFGISPTASKALKTWSPSFNFSRKNKRLTFSKAISRSSSGSS